MKYYSEVTSKVYDTIDALTAAEKAAEEKRKEEEARIAKEKAEKEKKANERKVRADEVEKARQVMIDAQKAYRELLQKFCRDYGAFHKTFTTAELPSLFDIFDIF